MTQEILYFLSLDQTHWLLSIGLVLFFAPFERIFPRVKLRAAKPGIAAILVVAICAYGTIWLFKESFYLDTVSMFLNLQFFSISKSNFSLPVLYIISFLLIDLALYIFHFLSHKVTFLWRMHSVHHVDEHVTAKTAILHHPLESLASLLFVLFFAVILGIPVIVLILYAGVATVHNFFAHANIALPKPLDRALRKLIVTPDMHRTHHSIEMHEGNSNFGQIFTFWDRLFRTYTDQPSTGEEELIMGLPASERPVEFTAKNLLLHPFAKLFKSKKTNR